jgi:hypothetical protein
MSKFVSSSKLAILIGILSINVLMATIGQDKIVAQDKSTSITCSTGAACEKTECTDDVCETTTTNSSSISSSRGPSDDDSDRRESIANSIDDKLNKAEVDDKLNKAEDKLNKVEDKLNMREDKSNMREE